jgi:predicted RNA binding protein YcfA (HicA-like mRNA interferase family)
MGSNLPVLKPKEVVAILEKLGFALARQRGSHQQFRHSGLRRTGNHRGIHSGESLIAWVDRCGHAVAGMLQGLSRKASRSAVKTGTSCARAVTM